MRGAAAVFGLVGLLASAAPVFADEGLGRWLVSGKVGAFAFTLNCTFDQAGESLGGVCVDASTSDPKVKGGRAHALTRGHIEGDHVRWSYQSSFLFKRFDVDYAGVRQGDQMSGEITVQGNKGAFTARRAGS
jgi:hypothetical protein